MLTSMRSMAGRQPAASLGRRIEALALTLPLLIVTLGIGWLAWSVLEWRGGRTPSYRLLGLRVVRRSDERPIGLGRSLVRSGICCPLMVIPTIAVCGVIGICFALGASPPDGLLRQPRTAPWDEVTATRVVDERVQPLVDPAPDQGAYDPIDLAGGTRALGPRHNGHVP
jgi:hypothetical protein